MFTTRKRVISQTLVAMSAVILGFGLSGCSGESEAQTNDKPSSSSSTSGADQAVAFAQCMRENGVPKYPDPEPDSDGRVRIGPGSGVDPNSPEFQKAMSACRDKMPQGQGGPNGGTVDSAKAAEWAKCMRKNGLPKMPDPEINGNELVVNVGDSGITPGDPAFQKAQQACQDKFPGGMLRLSGPGGPQ